MSRGRLWASLWEPLGDPGLILSRFEAIGKGLEFERIFDDFREGPKTQEERGWVVNH